MVVEVVVAVVVVGAVGGASLVASCPGRGSVASGLSGSGPAYIFLIIEALSLTLEPPGSARPGRGSPYGRSP